MALVSRAADLYYTYRFIKVLTTPWEDTEAYELGLIDDNGKSLRKAKTSDEKDAYTIFFRLAFNFKRILEKLPFGKSRISSYAAALFLLREATGMSEEEIKDILIKNGYRLSVKILKKVSLLLMNSYNLAYTYYMKTFCHQKLLKLLLKLVLKYQLLKAHLRLVVCSIPRFTRCDTWQQNKWSM